MRLTPRQDCAEKQKPTKDKTVTIRYDVKKAEDMCYRLDYVCASDIGCVRNINQDNYICDGRHAPPDGVEKKAFFAGSIPVKRSTVVGVFDGVGGEERGEMASYLAAQTAANIRFGGMAVRALGKYCAEANAKICHYATAHEITAMSTTAAMLLFGRRRVTLCNVGDSRIYRYSEGELRQISKDHAVASAHGKKPLLYQSLGIPPEQMIIEPYFSQGKLIFGDRYLICSDGLSDMVPVCEMEAAVLEKSICVAAERLLQRALENGGKDNVTLIIIEINRSNAINFLKRKGE